MSESRPTSTLTFGEAVEKIESFQGKPVAVEALWDGDSYGWSLWMSVVLENSGTKFETKLLSKIMHGGDIRIFQGTVPPYPEALVATEIGEKLAAKYGLEFFFPSPTHPDDDCPSWTMKHLAINCKDCEKLILPNDSPYVPNEICHHCYLERKKNADIMNAKPCDDGIKLCFSKGDEVIYCGHYVSKFEYFSFAEFVQDIVDERKTDALISVVTISTKELDQVREKLELKIDKKLEKYSPPRKSSNIITKNYKGRNIELSMHIIFGREHKKLLSLLGGYERICQAVDEGYNFRFHFKNGITMRDDSILRFIHFKNSDTASEESIYKEYVNVLSKEEVHETLSKLESAGCLICEESIYSSTQLGRNIL